MKLLPFVLFLLLSSLTPASFADDKIPSDVRYMIEDLYGADKSKWPKTIFSRDVNADGMADWLVQQPGCKKGEQCLFEIFVCHKSEGGKCLEYCYIGSGTEADIQKNAAAQKCQATC
jgi:hypothetical protein